MLKISTQPRVCIVIPAYNHADYLEEAIESVLAQDYSEIELIVINDGSTDHTAKVLEQYEDIAFVVHQENMGQSRSLELGWSMATGHILGYLSADDCLRAGMVTRIVEAMEQKPEVVACYPDFSLFDSASRPIRRVSLAEFDYEKMFSTTTCPIGPGAFFRSTVYEKVGPWNSVYRQMPDYDFWLRVGLLGQIIHIPEDLALFRVHDGSQSHSVPNSEQADEPSQIACLHVERAGDRFSEAVRNRGLASAHLMSAQLHLRAGRLVAARNAIKKAYSYERGQVYSVLTFRRFLNAVGSRALHKLIWKFKNATQKLLAFNDSKN